MNSKILTGIDEFNMPSYLHFPVMEFGVYAELRRLMTAYYASEE